MSLYVMADLHLSSDGSKSMEKFGSRWTDYMNKIRRNWSAVVGENDTVIIPGDVSWSLKLEDAADDLRFLASLPGKKLLGKGNHDFWWSTATKMKAFFHELGIEGIDILYNNAHLLEDCVVCGTRGWFIEEELQNTVGNTDYTRICNRELIRLKLSLEEAKKLQAADGRELPILVFLHFPPIWGDFICREMIDLMHEYNVKDCYFGHIHGAYYAPRTQNFEGIDFVLCAADYLNFTPMPVVTQDFC